MIRKIGPKTEVALGVVSGMLVYTLMLTIMFKLAGHPYKDFILNAPSQDVTK